MRRLRRFDQIALRPGETKTVTFVLPLRELAYAGPTGAPVLEPGAFDLRIADLERFSSPYTYRAAPASRRRNGEGTPGASRAACARYSPFGRREAGAARYVHQPENRYSAAHYVALAAPAAGPRQARRPRRFVTLPQPGRTAPLISLSGAGAYKTGLGYFDQVVLRLAFS